MSDNPIGNILTTGGVTVRSQVALSRPANTTAYAAGDVVGSDDVGDSAIITLPNCARLFSGTGIIFGAELVLDDALGGGDSPEFDLFIFDNNSVTNYADNAVFAPSDDDLENSLVGVVQFTDANKIAGGASHSCFRGYLLTPIAFASESADKALYGILVNRAAWTPESNATFTTKLFIEQN